LWRDEKKIEKVVTLKPRSDSKKLATNDSGEDEESTSEETKSNNSITFDKLGFSVSKADNKIMKQREVSSAVIVSDLKQFGEAATRGLRVDDIILEADRKPVATVSEFEKIVKSKKPGDALMLRVKDASGTARFVAVMIPKQ
jgi:S1-C subfamily serine protease